MGSGTPSSLGTWEPGPPPIHVAAQPSSFSPRAGWGWGGEEGRGGTIYTRQNQREQLEAEARMKPHRPPSQGKGLSVVRGSLAHSQTQGQARTNRAGSPQRPRQPETPSAIHLSVSHHAHGPSPMQTFTPNKCRSGIITTIVTSFVFLSS